MAREIRITVDDDEVFERMKRRKRALDLSWEEVLYRGLDERPDEDIGDKLGRQIEARVANTIRSSLGIDPDFDPQGGSRGSPEYFESSGFDPTPDPEPEPEPEEPAGLEDEMDRLANAEDAVLTFDSLDGESYAVPLRVNLATSADGLDVDVVTVRAGKSVAELNRFDGNARATVTRQLATGGTARLELGDGAEVYDVRAALTWGRRDDGTPTVTDAEITDVVFDGDE